MIARGRLSPTKEGSGGRRATLAQESAASEGRGADCASAREPGCPREAKSLRERARGRINRRAKAVTAQRVSANGPEHQMIADGRSVRGFSAVAEPSAKKARVPAVGAQRRQPGFGKTGNTFCRRGGPVAAQRSSGPPRRQGGSPMVADGRGCESSDGAVRSTASRAIATAREGGGITAWRRCTKPVRSDAAARPRRLQRSHYPRRSLDLVRGSNHAGGRHNLQPAPGGTPDSEIKNKCKGRDGKEGWQTACRKCTGRDAFRRRSPCPKCRRHDSPEDRRGICAQQQGT
jgi:hypothetical protein